MKVVVVTGSRHWTDEAPIVAVLDEADLLIVGDAMGADLIALKAATAANIRVLLFEAKWDVLGKIAGPRRNEEMAQCARGFKANGAEVFGYAFPLPDSRGTWDCVERLMRQGILVTVFDGEVS